MNIIKLKCKECNGTMEVDKEKGIICCPYCGSKELIDESDAVKIVKTITDAELEKDRLDRQERKEADKSTTNMLKWAIAIFLILLILYLIFQ